MKATQLQQVLECCHQVIHFLGHKRRNFTKDHIPWHVTIMGFKIHTSLAIFSFIIAHKNAFVLLLNLTSSLRVKHMNIIN